MVADVLCRDGGLGCRVDASRAIDHDNLTGEISRCEEQILGGGVVETDQRTSGGCQRVECWVDPLKRTGVKELQRTILGRCRHKNGSTTVLVCPGSDGGVRLCHVGVDGEAPVWTFGGRRTTIGNCDWSHLSRKRQGGPGTDDVTTTDVDRTIDRGLQHTDDIQAHGNAGSFTSGGLVDHRREKPGGFSRHTGGAEDGVWRGGLESGDLGIAVLSGTEEGCSHDEGSDFEHVCFHIYVCLFLALGFLGLAPPE